MVETGISRLHSRNLIPVTRISTIGRHVFPFISVFNAIVMTLWISIFSHHIIKGNVARGYCHEGATVLTALYPIDARTLIKVWQSFEVSSDMTITLIGIFDTHTYSRFYLINKL